MRARRHRRLVLIGGEAGIGKTALVRALCAGGRAPRALWGACDALHTPRPLGPLLDIAGAAGGALAAAVEEGASPGTLLAALSRDLRRPPPAVVVLEDLHWADEATLDVLRLLARRIESVPALVVATYRDDGLDRGHRVAVEEALAPHVRADLHRRALAAVAAAGAGRGDLARLAHHADAAGDADAVLRHGPAAAERAARLGSHREAAAQLARALRHGDRLPAARRAELLERRSYECYLIAAIDDALAARERALGEHRAAGDGRREGDAHRWLSRLHWFWGDNAAAEREARIAVELLEALPPGRELAMAYSNMAQLRMLAADRDAAVVWGGRALALAERLADVEVVAHALNSVGAAERARALPEGTAKLERSLALALEADLEEHVARAYTNLVATAIDLREYATPTAASTPGSRTRPSTTSTRGPTT